MSGDVAAGQRFAALSFLQQFSAVTEAALKLSPEIATEFTDWFSKR